MSMQQQRFSDALDAADCESAFQLIEREISTSTRSFEEISKFALVTIGGVYVTVGVCVPEAIIVGGVQNKLGVENPQNTLCKDGFKLLVDFSAKEFSLDSIYNQLMDVADCRFDRHTAADMTKARLEMQTIVADLEAADKTVFESTKVRAYSLVNKMAINPSSELNTDISKVDLPKLAENTWVNPNTLVALRLLPTFDLSQELCVDPWEVASFRDMVKSIDDGILRDQQMMSVFRSSPFVLKKDDELKNFELGRSSPVEMPWQGKAFLICIAPLDHTVH